MKVLIKIQIEETVEVELTAKEATTLFNDPSSLNDLFVADIYYCREGGDKEDIGGAYNVSFVKFSENKS